MKKKKRKTRIPWFLRGFLGLAVFLGLLFYGPFEQFRRLWIHTAMYSSRHQFLASALYTQAYIHRVLDKNAPFPQEKTVSQGIPPEGWTSEVYCAEIQGNYYRGYIIKLEDPRRLSLVPAPQEQGILLETLAAAQGGLGGVNCGGYGNPRKRGIPWGTVLIEGILQGVCAEHEEHTIGGLTGDYQLKVGRMKDREILEQNFQWAFEFGPLLIVNGEKTAINPYTGGLAPRTAVGQTKEGHILLVVVDGRQPSSIGATYQDIQNILYANHAINAIGLDGGSSSCMVYQGRLINTPSEGTDQRLLPNALIFK